MCHKLLKLSIVQNHEESSIADRLCIAKNHELCIGNHTACPGVCISEKVHKRRSLFVQ